MNTWKWTYRWCVEGISLAVVGTSYVCASSKPALSTQVCLGRAARTWGIQVIDWLNRHELYSDLSLLSVLPQSVL